MTKYSWLNLSLFLVVLLLAACKNTYEVTAPGFPNHNQQIAINFSKEVLNYLHKGYTDYAQDKLYLALHAGPHNPIVLDTAGYFYEKTGRLKIANNYYKQAITDAPESATAKNNYGAFLCRNGHYRDSVPYFLEASNAPNSPVSREARQNAKYCEQQIKTKLGEMPI